MSASSRTSTLVAEGRMSRHAHGPPGAAGPGAQGADERGAGVGRSRTSPTTTARWATTWLMPTATRSSSASEECRAARVQPPRPRRGDGICLACLVLVIGSGVIATANRWRRTAFSTAIAPRRTATTTTFQCCAAGQRERLQGGRRSVTLDESRHSTSKPTGRIRRRHPIRRRHRRRRSAIARRVHAAFATNLAAAVALPTAGGSGHAGGARPPQLALCARTAEPRDGRGWRARASDARARRDPRRREGGDAVAAVIVRAGASPTGVRLEPRFADHISASVLNPKAPRLSSTTRSALRRAGQDVVRCSFPSDGGTMSRYCQRAASVPATACPAATASPMRRQAVRESGRERRLATYPRRRRARLAVTMTQSEKYAMKSFGANNGCRQANGQAAQRDCARARAVDARAAARHGGHLLSGRLRRGDGAQGAARRSYGSAPVTPEQVPLLRLNLDERSRGGPVGNAPLRGDARRVRDGYVTKPAVCAALEG